MATGPMIGPRAGSGGWWSRVPPNAKRWIVLGLFAGGLLLIVTPMASTDPKRNAPRPSPLALDDILTSADTREIGLTGVSRQVDGLESELRETQRKVDGLETDVPTGGTDASAREELKRLRAEVDSLREQMLAGAQAVQPATLAPDPYVPGGYATPQRSGTPVDGVATQAVNGQSEPPPQIRTVALVETPRESAAAPVAERSQYLPAGAIITGVLMTGVDAPTGRVGQGNPIPALIRVKQFAKLPNRYKLDVRECFVIVDAVGDIGSERAMMRAQTLSCIRPDGGVIEARLEAYVNGEDGTAGLRGDVVSKQGAAIMKATVAGFADGVARAFGPQVSFGGVGGGVFDGQTLEAGAASGASSALDRVAKYYLDLSQTMLPVVVVHPKREVTLVVVRGTELKVLNTGARAPRG